MTYKSTSPSKIQDMVSHKSNIFELIQKKPRKLDCEWVYIRLFMGALCGALHAPENFFHYLHKNITPKKSSVIIEYSDVSNNLEALIIFETLKK